MRKIVLDPNEPILFNWERGREVSIKTGADSLAQEVIEKTFGGRQCDPERQFLLRQHCDQFQRLATCLRRSMAVQGVPDTTPIRIGSLRPSTRRSPGGVVYEFRVLSKRTLGWVREGLVPFPATTPMEFRTGPKRDDKLIEFTYQNKNANHSARATPFLLGCDGHGKEYRLVVRFPAEVDTSRIPDELVVRAAGAPPAEVTQIRHLLRWCETDNRAHPVLNAIVFSDDHVESLPHLRLFDGGVAQYPKQCRAVQLGASDQSLALIKGPPGTGKTTVITEIVRQLVLQGKRVLVCSQTHQAVRNVLERLHRAGGFRMARHVSEKRLNDLSPIESAYVAGGAEDKYHHSVLESARLRVGELEERLSFLRDGIAVLPQAISAAIELRDHRAHALKALCTLNEALQSDTDQANAFLTDGLNTEESKERGSIESASAQMAIATRSEKDAQKKLDRIIAKRDKVEKAYVRKSGNAPTETTVTHSWLGAIRDFTVPNWLVGTGTLQQRYSRLAERARAARIELSEYSPRVLAITEDIDRVRAERRRRETELRNSHSASVVRLVDQHAHESAQVKDGLRQAEVRLCDIQASAVPFVRHLGSSMGDDASPEAWQEFLDRLTAEEADAAERQQFIRAWASDIEAEPKPVQGCYWDHIQVFFATCVGVASWRRLVGHGRESIDLVIVDEAAHATATETLIPMLYAKRVLLIGDEMQLPPLLTADVGDCGECPRLERSDDQNSQANFGVAGMVRMSECWLERSFFEWLWRTNEHLPRVALDTQFRMHRSIADFVGSVFYPDGLTTGVADDDRHVAFGEFTKPVCLISTTAYDDRTEEYLQPGYRNLLEAKIIRRVLERAEDELAEPQEVGIITPYAHQVQTIQQMLAGFTASANKVRLLDDDIASVDSFQGSEKDIIIVSFVRSPLDCDRCQGGRNKRKEDLLRCRTCEGRGYIGTGLSFARDLRRLNVAFSRAKKMLILVGDIAALTDVRYRGGKAGGQVLRDFESYVADHGKVLHVWEGGYGRQ